MLGQRNTHMPGTRQSAAYNTGSVSISSDAARSFMSKIFSWMFIGLSLTAFVAWSFASSEKLMNLLISDSGLNMMGYLVMFAPFIMVLLMSFRFHKMSSATLTLMFGGYSILMGMSLSFILLVFTAASVFQTFAITAGMFGAMAIIGYTTKTDLTKFGAFLYMALIGLILAIVVNWFLGSSQLEYIISILGVLIFTGLTAYDTQKLKRIGSQQEGNSMENTNKLVIMGALTLYLDFINLFLFLLRFLGQRR
ncbi:MAG: Bax inhibitor-1/YccA family protein [Bacteroidales bacterium]